MLHIRELEKQGVDTSIDIYNTAFRDNRLKHDILTFEEEEGMELVFHDVSCLDHFQLKITAMSGYYTNRIIVFDVVVPEFFPNEPYKVKCCTPLFHPNIDDEGHVCLNILRENWMPSIDLKQIACSLQYLLAEPNPQDPLNEKAAAMLLQDPADFQQVVNSFFR